jgi:hypothetical protein
VSIEVQDAAGKAIRDYSNEATRPVRAEELAAPSDDESGPVRRAAPPVRLTANAGMNRLTWDFNDADGIMVAPGPYKVKVTIGSWTHTEPLTLKNDPRLVADGVTTADLREQYDHNVKAREMANEVGRVANRVRQARTRLRSGGNADSLAKVEALADSLFGPDEGIRYGRPGMQTQITYLAGMTGRVDQRVGQDAIERFAFLRKELSAFEVLVNRTLGPEHPLIP